MTPMFAVIDAPLIAIIGIVILVLFGAERLPKLARAMGEAKKEFESTTRAHSQPSPVEPPPPPPSQPPVQPKA